MSEVSLGLTSSVPGSIPEKLSLYAPGSFNVWVRIRGVVGGAGLCLKTSFVAFHSFSGINTRASWHVCRETEELVDQDCSSWPVRMEKTNETHCQ